MSMTLWGGLPESVWIARCALQMRQLEPKLDPSAARELAQSLLEDAWSALEPDQLAVLGPEEAAQRFASAGWVDYWSAGSAPADGALRTG